MTGFVGAQHEFHDAAFVRGWADRFVPTEPRLQLFDMILDQIRRPNIPNTHVVELVQLHRMLTLESPFQRCS